MLHRYIGVRGEGGTPGDTGGHKGTCVPTGVGTCGDMLGHAGTCVPALRGHEGTPRDTGGHRGTQADTVGHRVT